MAYLLEERRRGAFLGSQAYIDVDVEVTSETSAVILPASAFLPELAMIDFQLLELCSCRLFPIRFVW